MVVNFLGSSEHAASDWRWQGGNRVVANEWAKFGILQVEGSSAGLIEFIGSGFVLIYYFIMNGLQLIQRVVIALGEKRFFVGKMIVERAFGHLQELGNFIE